MLYKSDKCKYRSFTVFNGMSKTTNKLQKLHTQTISLWRGTGLTKTYYRVSINIRRFHVTAYVYDDFLILTEYGTQWLLSYFAVRYR
jgi:hypothetical protein